MERDLEITSNVDGVCRESLADRNGRSREHKRRANRQHDNNKCGLGVMAGLKLMVPAVKRLRDRADQAGQHDRAS